MDEVGEQAKRTVTMEEEVKRLVDAGRGRGVDIRVIGGIAVKLHSPSATHRAMSRTYGDIDFIGYRSQRTEISRLMEDMGYEPNRRFNALQGHRRLLFDNPELGYDADFFLDVFPMCHELNLVGRLHLDKYTVPIEDLLLSKLQVVELNEKDVIDVLALIHDHAIAEVDDLETIDPRPIAALVSNDWGWYKTLSTNVDKVLALADNYLKGEQLERCVERLTQLRQMMEDVPKSMKWKMRARIGEKKRWYDLPEDVVTHQY